MIIRVTGHHLGSCVFNPLSVSWWEFSKLKQWKVAREDHSWNMFDTRKEPKSVCIKSCVGAACILDPVELHSCHLWGRRMLSSRSFHLFISCCQMPAGQHPTSHHQEVSCSNQQQFLHGLKRYSQHHIWISCIPRFFSLQGKRIQKNLEMKSKRICTFGNLNLTCILESHNDSRIRQGEILLCLTTGGLSL